MRVSPLDLVYSGTACQADKEYYLVFVQNYSQRCLWHTAMSESIPLSISSKKTIQRPLFAEGFVTLHEGGACVEWVGECVKRTTGKDSQLSHIVWIHKDPHGHPCKPFPPCHLVHPQQVNALMQKTYDWSSMCRRCGKVESRICFAESLEPSITGLSYVFLLGIQALNWAAVGEVKVVVFMLWYDCMVDNCQ